MNTKNTIKILALVLSIFLITSVAWAGKGPAGQTQPPAKLVVCDNFVDANGDGICDNCKNPACQHKGVPTGSGPVCSHFIDTDNDGVCDNCGQYDGLHEGTCDGTGPYGPRP